MQQDTYEAIKTEWGKITAREQRALIYHYIQGDTTGLRGSWMEFLQRHFGLSSSTDRLPDRDSCKRRTTA